MRYDTPIYFQHITEGTYNALTGDYSDDTVEEVERWASVTDAGIDTLRLVYGEIKQGAKVVRLQTQYTESFNRIRIGEKRYSVDKVRNLRTKQTFVVSEVQ